VDVHRTNAARSGAGGDLPPWLGGQGGEHPAGATAATAADHSTSTANPTSTTVTETKSPTPTGNTAASTANRPSFRTPRAPVPVPEVSEATPPPPAKRKTEAQQARIRKKFQQLREKRRAREQVASQQHRLAKQPAPLSDPEAACSGPSKPTPAETM